MTPLQLQAAIEKIALADQPSRGLGHGVGHGVVRGVARGATYGNSPPRLAFDIPSIDEVIEDGLLPNALHEIRCSYARDISAAAGFACSLISRLKQRGDLRKILWITDPASAIDCGNLFPAGLMQYGIDPLRFSFVKPPDLQKAMWAADEAAGCADLAALVFQVKGNPAKFDMTATRRLMFRARQSGTLSLILRQSGEEEASATATRWHIRTQASLQDDIYQPGIGRLQHTLTLERNRNGQLGQWSVAWNPTEQIFENATPPDKTAHFVHRLHPPANRPHRPHEMGQVMALKRPS